MNKMMIMAAALISFGAFSGHAIADNTAGGTYSDTYGEESFPFPNENGLSSDVIRILEQEGFVGK